MHDNAIERTLEHVFYCSDFVAQSCHQSPEILETLKRENALTQPYTIKYYQTIVQTCCDSVSNEADLMKRLRQLRNREMVRIAWRDLCQWASLEETLQDLSALANACLQITLDKLHAWQMQSMGLNESQQIQFPQLHIITLGKLGGLELNFSSDVDIMFCYPENGEFQAKRTIDYHSYFQKLAQWLIKILNSKTHDGFVFRVDTRLRPFGEAGPLCQSFAGLESYYQEQGRDWERYALLKANILGNETSDQQRLKDIIKPFVYRRYLDYSAIEALREMKQMIAREVLIKQLVNDIKRGPGGIRQIEFICQSFQLIRGGQKVLLQQRQLLVAFTYLEQLGVLPSAMVQALVSAYRYLRRLENILQMIADKQTHDLPINGSAETHARIAKAMNVSSWHDVLLTLKQHRNNVETYFNQLLSPVKQEFNTANHKSLYDDLQFIWQQKMEKTLAIELLANNGFESAEKLLMALAEFKTTRVIKQLQPIARNRLDKLMPLILIEITENKGGYHLAQKIIVFLESIARRSAYLSLLLENLYALSHLVKLFSLSEWVADKIIAHPLLLDVLLQGDDLTQASSQTTLALQLEADLAHLMNNDLEQFMEVMRRFKLRQHLRAAVAETMGQLEVEQVNLHLSHVAVVILTKVQDLICRHFNIDSDCFAIVAYGKLGSQEINYQSDLDLVFLHRLSGEQESLAPRCVQRIINFLTTRSIEGVLYPVDTRLRPSGASGLLVCHIDSFIDYQQTQAWIWEHQALVRARIVSGGAQLKNQFNQLRDATLSQKRDVKRLKQAVVEMRRKMKQALNKISYESDVYLKIKHIDGGLIDIEFLVQFGVLAWSHNHKELINLRNTAQLLDTFEQAGLLSKADVQLLTEAYHFYCQLIHQTMLSHTDEHVYDDKFPASVKAIWNKCIVPL